MYTQFRAFQEFINSIQIVCSWSESTKKNTKSPSTDKIHHGYVYFPIRNANDPRFQQIPTHTPTCPNSFTSHETDWLYPNCMPTDTHNKNSTSSDATFWDAESRHLVFACVRNYVEQCYHFTTGIGPYGWAMRARRSSRLLSLTAVLVDLWCGCYLRTYYFSMVELHSPVHHYLPHRKGQIGCCVRTGKCICSGSNGSRPPRASHCLPFMSVSFSYFQTNNGNVYTYFLPIFPDFSSVRVRIECPGIIRAALWLFIDLDRFGCSRAYWRRFYMWHLVEECRRIINLAYSTC